MMTDENEDERVLEAGEKLEQPMRRLLAGDLVRPDLIEALDGVGLDQALRTAADIGERGCEVVAGFANGGRRQRRHAITRVLRTNAIFRLG
jgi:hypothetical protein